jgi:hypothetical protein
MKEKILFASLYVGLVFLAAGCGLFSPNTNGQVQVANQYSGTCYVVVNLDGNNQQTLPGGNSYTYQNVSPGSHVLNFSFGSTNNGQCSAANCVFSSGGTSTTCGFTLSNSELFVSTLGNGSACQIVTVSCP